MSFHKFSGGDTGPGALRWDPNLGLPQLFSRGCAPVHRDITASLSPLDILREFSSRNQSRKEHFGKV